jgi:hypothetical protein
METRRRRNAWERSWLNVLHLAVGNRRWSDGVGMRLWLGWIKVWSLGDFWRRILSILNQFQSISDKIQSAIGQWTRLDLHLHSQQETTCINTFHPAISNSSLSSPPSNFTSTSPFNFLSISSSEICNHPKNPAMMIAAKQLSNHSLPRLHSISLSAPSWQIDVMTAWCRRKHTRN